jgi:hypothetical protein
VLEDVLENVFPTKIPRPHVVGLLRGLCCIATAGIPRISGESPSEPRSLKRHPYWENRDSLAVGLGAALGRGPHPLCDVCCAMFWTGIIKGQ